MDSKFSFGKIQFDVSLGSQAARARRDPEAPFGLAVLGDFSGRANRGLREPIGQRRIWRVDCDNLDHVISKLDASLRLPLSSRSGPPPDANPPAAPTADLHFPSLEHFHPDQFLKQVAPLAALVERRQRLLNPSTALAAASELQTLLTHQPAQSPAAAPPPGGTTPALADDDVRAPAESDADTLARLLGGAPQRPAPPARPPTGVAIERLIQNIVAPSIVAGVTPQQTALLSVLDLELTARLRSILHHPEFQALEASWRSLDLLVRAFGGEENLNLFLLDVSKAELAVDLEAHDQLEESGICKLIQRQADDQPWAAWLGLFTFADTVADVEMLGRLAKVSALVGAPFIASAGPALVSCDSFDAHPDPDDWKQPLPTEVREAWQALRELPETAYLGLAQPRFLLRQPYGKDSELIEAFPFEELPADLPHESYLWGNPAVVCGYLLAQAFQAEGWEIQAAGYGELGDLPVHKFKQEGETTVKPGAEAWLSERAAEAIRQKGLMPLLSIKGRDAVRLAGMQSLRSPACPLTGRWTG